MRCDPNIAPGLAQARRIVTDPALCAARPTLCIVAWAALRAHLRGDRGFQARLNARAAAGARP
jgi:hypothetical protein